MFIKLDVTTRDGKWTYSLYIGGGPISLHASPQSRKNGITNPSPNAAATPAMPPPPPPATVLVTNGTVSPQAPPSAASFLDSTPGAYTTARATAAGGLLWWPRHLLRLADSTRLLARFHPHLLGLAAPPPRKPFEDSLRGIEPLVNRSVRVALDEMPGEDMALTALLRASPAEEESELEVCVHLGAYVPPVFGKAGARLAVAGRGRDAAAAKYAPWARSPSSAPLSLLHCLFVTSILSHFDASLCVYWCMSCRMRKSMEKMRPPGVTELLLTNDGDHILEGSITNFFVVCRRVSLMLGFGFLGIQTKLLVPCYWISPTETTEK